MSYTLNYTGSEIDDILDRAAPGGAIDQALATKQDVLTFDAVPTEGSTNPAESGGIYDAIQAGGAAALAAFATDTVSGDVVSFPDGADGIPVKSFSGTIVPLQSGSGDPAPDNIRPISGWTGARLFDTGVNVWSEEWEQGAYNSSTGEKVVNSYAIRAKNLIPVKPNTDYFIKVPTVGARIFWYDINGAFIHTELANNVVKTSPSAAYFLTFNVGNQSNPITSYANNISINYPSTVTTYQPYNGSTILLSFGQTVYAGTLTALGGGLWKIQPTHGVIDLATAPYNINTQSTGKLFNFFVTNMNRTAGLVGWAEAYKQSFATSASAVQNGQFLIRSDANGVLVRTDGTETTLPTGNLVYPLATLPDPITITGEDLQTLLGANTVWQSCGAVTEMTYRADTALYIQKLIGGGGTLQTLSMASPSPSLSLGRVGVLAEPEADAEPEEVTEEPEADTEEATEE